MKIFGKINLVVLALAAAFSFAQNSAVDGLKSEFMQLKYEKKSDRESGALKMDKVFGLLDQFAAKTQSAQSPAEFTDLVQLVAAALPFDMETESAGQIEYIIHDSKKMRTAYEKALVAITDNCRRQLLQAVVAERSCLVNLEESGKANSAAPDKCVAKPVFNYEKCLAIKIEE